MHQTRKSPAALERGRAGKQFPKHNDTKSITLTGTGCNSLNASALAAIIVARRFGLSLPVASLIAELAALAVSRG